MISGLVNENKGSQQSKCNLYFEFSGLCVVHSLKVCWSLNFELHLLYCNNSGFLYLS